MGSIVGHKIDHNGIGALRGQQHIPSINLSTPPPPLGDATTNQLHLPPLCFLQFGCKQRQA